jgi:hypothetical protein
MTQRVIQLLLQALMELQNEPVDTESQSVKQEQESRPKNKSRSGHTKRARRKK